MDYQTHELFHGESIITRFDSIPPDNVYLPESQLPKKESAVGATRILFVDQAPQGAHEIDRKYLDLILGSRRWKLTASASGSIETQGYFGGGSAEIKVEGMFDILSCSITGGQFGDDTYSNIYTRSFDNGAVSQLEGNGYNVKSDVSSEEELIQRPATYYFTSSGVLLGPLSMFPSFSAGLSGLTIAEGGAGTTNFNSSKSYQKAGNFKVEGKHTGGGAGGSGLSFNVDVLYITQDKCYIDFTLGYGISEYFSGGAVSISTEELFYFAYDGETGNTIQKSKLFQSSVSMTILGTPNSQYKLYQSSGYEGEFDGASVGNITVDIVQVEAL